MLFVTDKSGACYNVILADLADIYGKVQRSFSTSEQLIAFVNTTATRYNVVVNQQGTKLSGAGYSPMSYESSIGLQDVECNYPIYSSGNGKVTQAATEMPGHGGFGPG